MPERHLTDRQAPAGQSCGWSRTVEGPCVVWRAWRLCRGELLAWTQLVPIMQGRRTAALMLRVLQEHVRARMAQCALVQARR